MTNLARSVKIAQPVKQAFDGITVVTYEVWVLRNMVAISVQLTVNRLLLNACNIQIRQSIHCQAMTHKI